VVDQSERDARDYQETLRRHKDRLDRVKREIMSIPKVRDNINFVGGPVLPFRRGAIFSASYGLVDFTHPSSLVSLRSGAY
jgi:hypothetical protein